MCDCFSPPPVSASASCVSCQAGRGQTCRSDFPHPLLSSFFVFSHELTLSSSSPADSLSVIVLFLFFFMCDTHPASHSGSHLDQIFPRCTFIPKPKKPPHPSLSPPLSFKDFQMLPFNLWNVQLHVPPTPRPLLVSTAYLY